MELKVDSKLSYCSIPSNTTMKYSANTGSCIIKTSKPSREIIYYFRTEKELAPKLLYGKVDRLMDHPLKPPGKYVAVSVSMLPSYWDNLARMNDKMIIAQNKTPIHPQE